MTFLIRPVVIRNYRFADSALPRTRVGEAGCESEEWREVKEWRKVNIFGGVLKKDMGRQEEERERAANGEFSTS